MENKIELIQEYPYCRKDILYCNDVNHNFGNIIHAMNYCIENKIPFLCWNDRIFDWNCKLIEINGNPLSYFNLPEEIPSYLLKFITK